MGKSRRSSEENKRINITAVTLLVIIFITWLFLLIFLLFSKVETDKEIKNINENIEMLKLDTNNLNSKKDEINLILSGVENPSVYMDIQKENYKASLSIIEEQREATIEEIAKELEVEKEEVIISLDAIQEPISLQEPAYSENTENIYIMDQVKDQKNTDELWTQNLTIAESLKRLSEKEKMIINKRFFEGKTQMEVAKEIGISQAQVSRLERTAINHIRRIYK